ncbi:hypothetical protein K493DRAFT_406876 [Basidiobolus meristosporus CBS 931.73]|uniref:BD-FAE-like domain-containing protein n=1 Tax=Basidiobolus meristosporus CBS 931.73 TaxID=1314790 RepID=A0A1Y1YHZ8_9FUNG|nr:hypothetical protein K493DRAFT_406876 [Basidiobolus meristosporus CBS 931.73]|eukprot:ORX97667.1 hypothetical protein K493DRAFT_406876 [Basidiobolus meristosporus CBS 931.73]
MNSEASCSLAAAVHTFVKDSRLVLSSTDDYITLIEFYAKNGKLREATEKFLEMGEHGFKLGPAGHHRMIHLFGSQSPSEAFNLYRAMLKLGVSPDRTMYHILLTYCLKQRNPSLLAAIHGEISRHHVPASYEIRSLLITGYCKNLELGKAKKLLQSFQTNEPALSISTYNLLMSSLVKVSCEAEALKVFDHMVTHDVAPNTQTSTILTSIFSKMPASSPLIEAYMSRANLYDSQAKSVAYNSLLHAHIKQVDKTLALETYERMVTQEVHPNRGSCHHVLNALVKTSRMSEAEALVASMVSRNIEPTPLTYNILINGWVKQSNFKKAKWQFQEMIKRQLLPSVATYTILLNGFAKAGDSEEIAQLCRDMEQRGVAPDAKFYTSRIHACIRLNELDQGIQVYQKMLEQNIQPDVVTYSTVIEAYMKQTKVDQAIEAYEQMQDRGVLPNTVIYTNMFRGYVQLSRFQDALRVFHTLRKKNIRLDIIAYTVMIEAFLQHANIPEALALYEEVFSSREKPDVVFFTALIHGLSAQSSAEQIRSLFNLMKEQGLVPDLKAYNTLINALVQKKDVAGAAEVLADMESQNISPDVATYSTLIHGYVSTGDLLQAMKLYSEMRTQGVSPNVYTLTTLINGFAKRSDMKTVFKLLQEMLDRGLFPNEVTYVALIHACTLRLEMVRAMKLYQSMLARELKPNIQIYTSLIRGFARLQDMESGDRLLEEMSARGLQADVKTYSVIIAGYMAHGDSKRAVAVYHDMLARELTPDLSLYTVLIDGYAKLSEMDRATKLFHEMKSQGVRPDVCLYTAMINGYSRDSDMDKAQRLFEEMLAQGIQPDVKLYTSLISGYAKKADLHGARKLTSDMTARGIHPDAHTHFHHTYGLRWGSAKNSGLSANQASPGDATIAKTPPPESLDPPETLPQVDLEKARMKSALRGLDYEGAWQSFVNLVQTRGKYHVPLDCLVDLIRLVLDHKTDNLRRLQQLSQLVDYLSETRETLPTLEDYTLVMRYFGKHGHRFGESSELSKTVLKQMLYLYQEMVAKSIPIDHTTYNALIKGLCKNARVSQAMELYRHMLDSKVTPTVATYNTLLSTYTKSSKLHKALELYDEMKGMGLVGDTVTYTTLINGLLKIHEYRRAMEVYKEMVDKKVRLNVITYTTLINGHVKQGNISEAMKVYSDMVANEISPNVVTYNVLINGQMRDDNLEAAMELYRDMLAHSIAPTVITFNTLIEGFVRIKDVESVTKLYRDMLFLKIQPTEVTRRTIAKLELRFVCCAEPEEAKPLRCRLTIPTESPSIEYGCMLDATTHPPKNEGPSNQISASTRTHINHAKVEVGNSTVSRGILRKVLLTAVGLPAVLMLVIQAVVVGSFLIPVLFPLVVLSYLSVWLVYYKYGEEKTAVLGHLVDFFVLPLHPVRIYKVIYVFFEFVDELLTGPFLPTFWQWLRVKLFEPGLPAQYLKKNIVYDEAHPNRKLDIYLPSHPNHPQLSLKRPSGHTNSSEAPSSPVIVVACGGTWNRGSRQVYSPMAQTLRKLGYLIVLMEGDHFKETTIGDMVAAMQHAITWVFSHIREYGGDPNQVYLMGHGSGAHLVSLTIIHDALTSLDLLPETGPTSSHIKVPKWNLNRAPKARGLILFSGMFDTKSQYHHERYRGIEEISGLARVMGLPDAPNGLTSPSALLLHALERENQDVLRSLLPSRMLIVHGDKDNIVPLHSARTFFNQLCKVGIADVKLKIYSNMKHINPAIGFLAQTTPFCVSLLNDVESFVQS